MATCRDCGTTLIKDHDTTAPVAPDGMPCVSDDGAHTEARPLIVAPLSTMANHWCTFCCGAHRHRATYRLGLMFTCDRHLHLACREQDRGTVLFM